MKPLVSVIIHVYDSMRYIQKCLDAVFAQTYPQLEVIAVINQSKDGSKEFIRERYGRHKRLKILDPGENLWFSRGNNFGIDHAEGEYILALNHDTIMEPDFVSRLVKEMEQDPSLGSVTGKLLHYRYDIDSKTKILDSTGIEIFRTRRVIDRGQWEEDRGQYDADTEVFGASGAAAMYRRSALEAVKLPKREGGFEYFDDDFIAYKEDVDLAWRLQLAGFHCRYVPEARVFHGRVIGRSWPWQLVRFILNRRHQPRLIRQLSFKNHYLMMVKNELPSLFFRHLVFILIRELLLLIFTMMFEQFQVFVLPDFFRQLPEARRKRKLIMSGIKISRDDLRRLFH